MRILMIILGIISVLQLFATIINIPADQATIQEGINVALDCDTLLIEDGLFVGNLNKNLTWNGDEKHLIIRSVNGYENCIIDCEESGSGFHFDNSNQTNADCIEGITIKNGSYLGIYCNNASPTISNCNINNNNGGIGLINNDSKILNNIIDSNSLSPVTFPHWISGGGIFIGGGSPFVFGNKIIHNIAYTDEIESMAWAGGISINNSNCILRNNLIIQNISSHSPSGLDVLNYSNSDYYSLIENNTFYGNYAPNSCAIKVRSNTIVRNNLICENSNDGIAGSTNDHSQQITNNCIWGHNQDFVHCPEGVGNTSWGFNYNGTSCDSLFNISENPFFVSTLNGDFFLSQTEAGQIEQSPCINAGFEQSINYGLENCTTRTDLICDEGIVDIGYHYPGFIPQNIIDMVISSKKIQLSNYPNPFNPSTKIKFSIPNDSQVDLSIFNIKGQKIKTLVSNEFIKGSYSIIWNGDNEFNKHVGSGVYLYKLNINGKTEAVKKCLLLK